MWKIVDTFAISSPMPRAINGWPYRHIGTSAPKVRPIAAPARSFRYSRALLSARKVAAASLEPPPIPEAMAEDVFQDEWQQRCGTFRETGRAERSGP